MDRSRFRGVPPLVPVRLPLALALPLVLVAVAGPGASRASAQGGCANVTCSGHGACIDEDGQGLCFCDEGYAAEGEACVVAEPLPSRPRTSAVGGVVASLATREAGRDLETVGKSLELEGLEQLARYVRPGGLWCSDFVSWVYRAAGVPFTGGSHGGWMLANNVAIRRWFQRRGLWVQRGSAEYERFVPRPGDYVRLHGRRWGHSAIVRYVVGSTLYLVEGNAGRRVRLTRYRSYLGSERIDGFGILTSPEARQAQLVRAVVDSLGNPAAPR